MNDFREIRKNVTQGLKWVSAGQGLNYLIQFLLWAILARLLPPTSFGALSVAMVAANLVTVFNELGMSTAIVQRQELEPRHLNAAFLICIAIGFSFVAIAAVASPFIAAYFKNPTITSLVMILAGKYLVDSFGIIHEATLRRELSFRNLSIIDIWSNLVYSGVTLTLAVSGLGIVSVGWGYLASSLVRVSQLWAKSSFRPNFTFDKTGFKDLFHYGRNIMGYKFINYFTGNLDVVLVGKFLGTSALGFYSLALALANFPRVKLSQLVSNIAFPAFSRMQADFEQVRQGYLKIIRYMAVINFPLLVGLMLLAPQFVLLVYSSKWLPLVLPLRILCVYGICFALTTFIGTVFESVGRPDYSLKYCLISLGSVAIAIMSGVKQGLVGIAVALAVYAIAMNIIGHLMVKRVIQLPFRHYLKALVPATISSVIMAAGLLVLIWLQHNLIPLPNLWFVLQSLLAGILFYAGGLFLFSRQTFKEMQELSRELIKTREGV